MTAPTLLADLALRLAKSPEDIATEAMSIVLRRSGAARQALSALLAQWADQPTLAVSQWTSQVGGSDEARPDLEGRSDGGELVAIIENKFWAGLTDHQPTTYLSRIAGSTGILVFVGPTPRTEILTLEIAERSRASGLLAGNFESLGASRRAKLRGGETIVVTNWALVLQVLAAALEASGDHSSLADLRQLQGLANAMERSGFQPLSSTDITGPTPRRILQYCTLVDAVIAVTLRKPYADKKGLKATAGAGWYGHYFRMHGFGCQLALMAGRWAAYGLSPIWLRIASPDWKYPTGLAPAIAAVLPDPSWLSEEKDSWLGLWIPLRLDEGREHDVVVNGLSAQLDRIAIVLEAHVARGSQNSEPPPERESQL